MNKTSAIKNIIVASFISWLLFIFADFIWPLPLNEKSKASITVVSEQGIPLRVFSDDAGIWRFKTSVDQVSPLYIEALINYEDKYFYQHPGINPFAMIRAAGQNIAAGKIVSGASTITMQTARLIDPHNRTFRGKFKQIFRALQLEWHFSKTEILSRYLEIAPFGGNLEGVEAASRAYFDKSPIELSHAEAALLVVLPQSPSRFRPDRYPQKAAKARDKVVQRMVDNQVWQPSILDDVVIESVYATEPVSPIIAPLFSRRVLNASNLEQHSTISTSVNLGLQLALQTRLKDFAALLPNGTTASAVIVENSNWLVKAYVGSAFFADEATQGYVDMVTAVRSPGSTLKPFIYGMAMDESLIHSQSLLVDAPRWRSKYQPENFSNSFSGAVSATTALQTSLNLPAVQVLEKLTPKLFTSRLLNVGIRPIIPSGRSNLAMALGGFGISMEELLNLYGALARNGKVAELRLSEDQPLAQRPLLSPQSAWIVFNMLSSQKRPDRPFDSTQTGWKNNLAFKTGTSYGYRDAWAFGVSGKYTIGVWVGRPDGTPSPGQFGAVTALPLLFQVSDWLGDSTIPKRPYQVSEAEICWPSGLIKQSTPKNQCLVGRKAMGIDGQFPATIAASLDDPWNGATVTLQLAEDSGLRVEPNCDIVTVSKQLSLWPVATESWLKKQWRRAELIPKSDPRCDKQAITINHEFAISSIKNNSHLRNLNANREFQLPLATHGNSGHVQWYLDGKKLTGVEPNVAYNVSLDSGQHELIAIDESGALDRIGFTLEQW